VNSFHHQAVKDVGRGLVVSARATDGVIEGIEAPGARFALGVQWHPESFWDRPRTFQPLFEAVVRAGAREGARVLR
jgi:putative glutamine amidotransferase